MNEGKERKPEGKKQSDEKVVVTKLDVDSTVVSKKVTSMVSNQITSMVNGKLIRPASGYLISKGVNNLTSNFEKKLEKYKDKRRTEALQKGDKQNRVPKKYKEAHKNEQVMRAVDTEIRQFSNNDKVDLQHLNYVCEANKCQIKVYDDKGRLVRRYGSKSNGEKSIKMKGSNGQYTAADGSNVPRISTNQNDSVFNLIANHRGESDPQKITQMRANTVDKMHENPNALAWCHNDTQSRLLHTPR